MNVDAHLKELGAEPVVGDQFLVVKEDELREIEQKLAVRLPKSYRKLLLTFGAIGFRILSAFVRHIPFPKKYRLPGRFPFLSFTDRQMIHKRLTRWHGQFLRIQNECRQI